MGETITQKILKTHLVSGSMTPGEKIGVRIDQTLTQDATGTLAYLQFEAMNIPRVRTKLSVSYVDHNTLQHGFENADDHKYLQSVAGKYGVIFSKPGSGICHQVHLERFGLPGDTLLGSDSHTPTAGGMGLLAFGAGGLDVAVAMGGGAFYLAMPKIMKVNLHGSLRPWCSAKDIILELLRRLSVKGGVGWIIEYGGDGVENLEVPQRATITNMGAELGLTTSVFPSDHHTRDFLEFQGRGHDWVKLDADADAQYEQVMEVNLGDIEPLIALPHSPDNVRKVSEVAGMKIDQVAIGSCTNSSYRDLMTVAAILKGKRIHPSLSLVISPGSKQVYEMLARNGALADLISAGARILECTCGPCIGMGQAPPTEGVTIRTFNRNFEGRSGTARASVYLTSPEVGAVSALHGEIADPRKLGAPPSIPPPPPVRSKDSLFIYPPEKEADVAVVRGPNIKPLPVRGPLEAALSGMVLLKMEDNITTDHIMPAGAKILPLRSNIPAMSDYAFERVDPTFAERARKAHGGFVVGGENYGQGSSREHAAIVPMYLGIKGVIARSFARIHRANLVNFGIVPMTFSLPGDSDKIGQGDEIEIEHLHEGLAQNRLKVRNNSRGTVFEVNVDLDERAREIIMAGGLLNFMKNQSGG